MRHLIVKVMAKKLADGKFYKQKGYVRKVHDKFVAEVKMIKSGAVLKIDQVRLPIDSFSFRVTCL